MIKKILITILVLIILVIIGLVSLVLFVDPNNFRGFISETVKDKTGYELTIEGDLRWHVWPQISILSGAVRLEDEGAKKPILTADNMRLDVELFPLFSKELSVKNIFVKSAVINITDESKGKVASGTTSQTMTINQQPTETKPVESYGSPWTFALNKLQIADSTVVWQQDKQDIISFRDINVSIYQKDNNNVDIDLSGTVNRDQRDLAYTFNAGVNLQNYPQTVQVALNKFTYDISGVGIPAGGVSGTISATLNYQKTPLIIDGKNFVATVNDNKIAGTLKAVLDDKPYVEAILSSDKIDLTPLLAKDSDTGAVENGSARSSATTAPVVSSSTKGNELAFLKQFDAKFNLKINQVLIDKLVVSQVEVDAVNKAGIATLNKVNLDIANGKVVASGSANGTQSVAAIKLNTEASQIDLGTLFSQLALTNHFSGQLNANGHITTNTIDSSKLLAALKGDMKLTVDNARLENINIQQIIQAAVAQYSKDVATPEIQQKYTEVHQLSADAKLADGQLNLTSLLATSETLDITGNGYIGLVKQDMDLGLNVKILGGWNGKSDTIQKLQKITIPFRIYGEFSKLHYQLNVEKLIKDQLTDKIQQGLDKLKDRLQNSLENKESGSEAETEAEGKNSDGGNDAGNRGADKLEQLFDRLRH